MGERTEDSALIEAFFQSSVIGVALFDRQLRYVRINDALASLNGAPAAEHIGKDVATLAPLTAELVRPWLEEVLHSGHALLGYHISGAHRVNVVLDVIPCGEGVLAMVVDNTALHQAERAQLARLRLSELVSEVSAGFIELPAQEIALGVSTALRAVGEALDIDRTYVALLSSDRKSVKLVHDWEREPGGQPVRDTFEVSEYPFAMRRLLAGRDFSFGSLADAMSLPEAQAQKDASEFMAHRADALVVMPLRIGREVSGFVGFEYSRGPRQWLSDVLTSMRLTVEIVASALERKRQDEQIRERLQFESLISSLSHDFVTASAGALDEVVAQALAAICKTLEFERGVVYRRDPTHEYLDLWHEWLAPGVPSLRPEHVRLRRADITGAPPEVVKGASAILDVSKLRPEHHVLRRILKDHFAFAALVPLISSSETWGILGLHATAHRRLPEDFSKRLTIIGELFASVIARIEAERRREAAYKELESLKSRIERERDYLREELRSESQNGAIIGESEAMRATMLQVAAVAATQATVLVGGESGVGKELIARAIHEQSARREGPLVRVNCASIPRELFESEFFGHVRGSFTGAHKDRAGRFELADRGTLFLDEVGDIPLDLQAKLLRVLQEGEYERIGDERTRTTNVRVIAATNREIEDDIARGQFRRDLYYRLATFPIVVPPLRERGQDVLLLARHFVGIYARVAGKRGLTLEREHERLLLEYVWPGNVRELQHVIERAVILSSDGQLRLDLALPKPSLLSKPPVVSRAPEPGTTPLPMSMNDLKRMERDNVIAALEMARWQVAGAGGAAELLGLKPSTLRDRMRVLGIERSR